MTDAKGKDRDDADEQWLKREIQRRVSRLWMQHGDAIQDTPERIEHEVRSPDYRKNKEWEDAMAERRGARAREIMAQVISHAAELGIEDWSPLYVRACEEDEVLKNLKLSQ